MMLKRFVEHQARCRFGHRNAQRTSGVDDVGAINRQPQWVKLMGCSYVLEQSLTHQATRTVYCAATHPGLSRSRCASGAANCGGNWFKHYGVHTQHAASNLLGKHHKALTDLGSSKLQRGNPICQVTASGCIIVEAFAVHQVFDRHTPANTAADVGTLGSQARAARDIERVCILC